MNGASDGDAGDCAGATVSAGEAVDPGVDAELVPHAVVIVTSATVASATKRRESRCIGDKSKGMEFLRGHRCNQRTFVRIGLGVWMYFAVTACSAGENALPATAVEPAATASSAPSTTLAGEPAPTSTVVGSATAAPSAEPGVPSSAAAAVSSTTAARPSPATTAVINSSTIPGTSAPVSRGRLLVSATSRLNPDGENVTVRGSGFDVSKGIYVAVCNQPQVLGRRCVGGINIDGSSPQSIWISSNPPGYAAGLPLPFGDGGVFSVTLLAKAVSPNIDCTRESCGIVAFADHTRSDDRSQDVFIPVTFG